MVRPLMAYRKQRNGHFAQEVWWLVSVFVEDGHLQDVMDVFDRAEEKHNAVNSF